MSPGQPAIEEEGSCDSALVRSYESCTERSVRVKMPPAAIVAAIVVVALAGVPAFQLFDSKWPPE